MTQNQIAYWNLQESKRHNLVGEDETNRHNVVTEGETQRHNVMTENISIADLQEKGRHNRATEYETNRHNLQTEEVARGELSEKVRHNLETEAQGRENLSIQLGNLNELSRHNKAGERETYRHNLATESYSLANLSESQRHSLEEERRKRAELLETGRHNKASEQSAQLSAEGAYLRGQASKEANEITAIRDQVNKKLKETELQISKYNQLDKSKLTSAQIREVDQNIKKMQQDIKASRTSQKVSVWRAVNESVDKVNNILKTLLSIR